MTTARVLHLIDPRSPGGGACTLRLLGSLQHAANDSIGHDVIVIGSAADDALARRCGVAPLLTMHATCGFAPLAWRGLRDVIAPHERTHSRFDLIHAWTPATAALAALAMPQRARTASFMVGPVSGPTLDLFRAMQVRRPARIFAGSLGVQHALASIGVRAEQTLFPGVDGALLNPLERDSIRRGWAVQEQEFVVGVLGEPEEWLDIRIAGHIAVLVVAAGCPLRMVVHSRTYRRAESERWYRRMGGVYEHLFIVDDRIAEPWLIARALDSGLLFSGEQSRSALPASRFPMCALLDAGYGTHHSMPGVQPALWAMAAGVPIVAEAHHAIREFIEHGRNGFLFARGDLHPAALHLIDLYENKPLHEELSLASQRTIAQRYSIEHVRDTLDHLWENAQQVTGVGQ